MIKADSVERVEERETSLDLVGFDHAFQKILDRQSLAFSGEMIRDSENST